MAFAHVGTFHRTPDFTTRAASGFDDATAAWLPVDGAELTEWCRSPSPDDVALIDLDGLDVRSPRTEEILSNLRPALTEAREQGARVVFVSTRPLHDFPAMAGSSILLDAETVAMKPVTEGAARELAASLGVASQASQSNVAAFAIGSRALIWMFSDIDALKMGGNRKRALAAEREKEFVVTLFDELGPELCTWLEYWLFECQQDHLDALDIDERLMLPLKAAGVLTPLDNGCFKLLPSGHEDVWLAGLRESLSRVIEPPASWTAVASELFALEREVRHLLAQHYQGVLGDEWAETVLDQDREGIIELARRDAIPNAAALADVRSPLDWLQMSRLLELAAAEAAAHDRFLGLNEPEWRKLATDLLPVRHRVAHMRLVRSNDLEVLRRHGRLIRLRKKTAEASASDAH
ncbi:hypothetical protein EKO23_01925 [Nocardioides guangzhouensis]|uniref:Uncharacterized protein n=1 Tax=Nocardioides guangzhouensis TaxID=2497878 RepID=A0A4Q4ZM31_9ACTN|nr:hypothetical protein [Nocardioides guangzhouensis]RYP88671.1 hypothetical protein EKO23_01925 [Nocardioides guangzhouensis]